MRNQGFTLIEILVVVGILGILGGMVAFAMSGDGSKAESVLIQQGYKNITMDGHPFFGCGENDSFFMSEDFIATNANNVRVTGTVCCGILKGCTIRF